MAEGSVDITVHIDETLDATRLASIAERVRASVGVSSAVFHDSKPHFLLVRYDPAKTTSDVVHRLVSEQGVHAELIGF